MDGNVILAFFVGQMILGPAAFYGSVWMGHKVRDWWRDSAWASWATSKITPNSGRWK